MNDLANHLSKTLEQIRLLAARGIETDLNPVAALDMIEDMATLAMAQVWRQPVSGTEADAQ